MSTAGPSRRKARVQRRKPRPRWLELTLRWGVPALPALAGTGFVVLAWMVGWLHAAADEINDRALAWSTDLGLGVRAVVVEGRGATGRAELLDAVGVEIGSPLLAVDPAAIKARVETLRWVERAEVVREFPDRVRVVLSERRPMAIWQTPEGHVVVDARGRPIPGEDARQFDDLIIVNGGGAAERARDLLGLLATEPALMRRVRGASWVGDRRWDLFLDTGVVVRLPESAGRGWVRFARYAHDGLLDRAIESVDLRQVDRAVVRLTPGALTAGGEA